MLCREVSIIRTNEMHREETLPGICCLEVRELTRGCHHHSQYYYPPLISHKVGSMNDTKYCKFCNVAKDLYVCRYIYVYTALTLKSSGLPKTEKKSQVSFG